MSLRLPVFCLTLAATSAVQAQEASQTVTYRCGASTMTAEFAPKQVKLTMGNGRTIILPGRQSEKRFQYLDRTFEFSGTMDSPKWQIAYRSPVACTRTG